MVIETEMIDSDTIKINNLKSIPIINDYDRIIGLTLQDGSVIKEQDDIEFKDSYGQLHKRKIYSITSTSEFNYKVKVNRASIFKEVVVPMYFASINVSRFISHCFDIRFHEDTVTLIYFFNEELDEIVLNHKLFKSYTNVAGMCHYEMYIPLAYKEDYEILKEGKYSKLSKPFKSRVLSFFMGGDYFFTGTNTLQKAQQSSFYGSNDPQIVSKLNAVFIKSCALKEQLEKRLGVKLSNNQELATKPQII